MIRSVRAGWTRRWAVIGAVIVLIVVSLQQTSATGKTSGSVANFSTLGNDLAGTWSARRGTYRVLYRINEERHEVVVLRVEHRRDGYRRL